MMLNLLTFSLYQVLDSEVMNLSCISLRLILDIRKNFFTVKSY